MWREATDAKRSVQWNRLGVRGPSNGRAKPATVRLCSAYATISADDGASGRWMSARDSDLLAAEGTKGKTGVTTGMARVNDAIAPPILDARSRSGGCRSQAASNAVNEHCQAGGEVTDNASLLPRGLRLFFKPPTSHTCARSLLPNPTPPPTRPLTTPAAADDLHRRNERRKRRRNGDASYLAVPGWHRANARRRTKARSRFPRASRGHFTCKLHNGREVRSIRWVLLESTSGSVRPPHLFLQ